MTEKDEQIALFDWAQYRTDLQQMFHITNEGRRSVQHTMSLLRQGMKPGVPDNMLPLARGGKSSVARLEDIELHMEDFD